jgi:hypothetical protein
MGKYISMSEFEKLEENQKMNAVESRAARLLFYIVETIKTAKLP